MAVFGMDDVVHKLILGKLEVATLVIPRSDIEMADTSQLLKTLQKLKSTLCDGIVQCGSVDLSVQGYNDDRRELYEIPEVCRYFRLLSSEFPYWFYFTRPEFAGFHTMVSCACGAKRASPSKVSIDNGRLLEFLEQQFTGLNKLFDEFDLDSRYPALNKQISDQFQAHFGLG